MTTVELIGTAYEPAANSAPPGWCDVAVGNLRSHAARGFLIQLVAREIQINESCETWLRTVARQLESLAEPGSAGAAAACDRLASQTRALRAELVVLVHRLVGRRNQISGSGLGSAGFGRTGRLRAVGTPVPRRRVDVFALLAQPRSLAMVELLELHQQNLATAEPWIELAALRPVEQMLAGIVPLAIDIAGVDDSDLCAAAELFEARTQRVAVFGSLLASLVAADPRRSASMRAAEERAIAVFTKLLSECAEIGQQLDSWRHGFVR